MNARKYNYIYLSGATQKVIGRDTQDHKTAINERTRF